MWLWGTAANKSLKKGSEKNKLHRAVSGSHGSQLIIHLTHILL